MFYKNTAYQKIFLEVKFINKSCMKTQIEKETSILDL